MIKQFYWRSLVIQKWWACSIQREVRIHPSHTFLLCLLCPFLRCHDQPLRDKNSRIYCSSYCSLTGPRMISLWPPPPSTYSLYGSPISTDNTLYKPKQQHDWFLTNQKHPSLLLTLFHFKRHLFIFVMAKWVRSTERQQLFSASWSIITISN